MQVPFQLRLLGRHVQTCSTCVPHVDTLRISYGSSCMWSWGRLSAWTRAKSYRT